MSTHGGNVTAAEGGLITHKFPFNHATANLSTGAALYTPKVNDILYDAWIEVDTAWDGTTPHGDIGNFYSLVAGWFEYLEGAIDMTAADVAINTGEGLLGNQSQPNSLATINALVNVALGDQVSGAGPALTNVTPLSGSRVVPGKFTQAYPIKIVVSQTGAVTVQAFVLAASAPPTIPLVVVTGVNDTFVWTGTAGGGTPETFTVAAGSKANLAAIVAAMGAATGSVSGEAFSTKALPTVDATKILLTSVVDSGIAGNGDTITPGASDVSAGLGFANPSTFAGGTGGATGSSTGAAVLYLVTSTPISH